MISFERAQMTRTVVNSSSGHFNLFPTDVYTSGIGNTDGFRLNKYYSYLKYS